MCRRIQCIESQDHQAEDRRPETISTRRHPERRCILGYEVQLHAPVPGLGPTDHFDLTHDLGKIELRRGVVGLELRRQRLQNLLEMLEFQFEVIESGGAGAQDIWCAAASYAEGALGRTRGRLYIARARGPAETVPGRKGVVFSVEPTPGAFTSVSVSVRQAGMNLPIFHALQFCRNHILERED